MRERKDPHREKPHTSKFFSRDIDAIPVIYVLSQDPLLFAKAQRKYKIMSYPFCLSSLASSALMDVGKDRSLVNTLFQACQALSGTLKGPPNQGGGRAPATSPEINSKLRHHYGALTSTLKKPLSKIQRVRRRPCS